MHVTTLLLASLLLSSPDDNYSLKIQDQAPPFAMRDLEGRVISLRKLVGPNALEPKKTLLITFFATWCEPCKREIPVLREIRNIWRDKDVELIHIGLGQKAFELSPMALEYAIDWPVIPDSYGLLGRRYGAKQLPHLFIIDSTGHVAFQHRGILSNLYEVLNQELSKSTGIPLDSSITTRKVELGAKNTTSSATTMQFARAPSSSSAAEQWQPMADFLGEFLRSNVTMVQEKSYSKFEEGIQAGRYALFNAGPYLCQDALENYEPLVMLEREGALEYNGITFVRRESKLKKIQDLKGKVIGLVSPTSTSGGLYPQALLLDAGLKPHRDVKIKWFGSHAKVAQAVMKQWVHAGACFDDCRRLLYKSPTERAKHTRILGYTAQIPAEMIMVKRSLSENVKAKLRESLLAVPSRTGLLKQISGDEPQVSNIVRAHESDLASIRKVITRVDRNH